MKHRLLGLWALLLLAAPASAGIESEVNAVAADKLLARASLGVQVIALGNGPADMRELYARQSHVPLVPASNLKLVTTAAALERLGPDFRFQTRLFLIGEDLLLVGDGDPTLGDSALLKKVGWTPTSIYQSWAQQLQQFGVTRVRNVIVDDSVFDETFIHADWPADQLDEYYEAQVGGVNFHANLVEVMVGPGGSSPRLTPPTKYVQLKNELTPGSKRTFSAARTPLGNTITLKGDPPSRGGHVLRTVHDPAMYAATVLAETLAASQVEVTGVVSRDRTFRERLRQGAVPEARPVGVHETPLPPVLARTNKESANLYAESLCKRMGFDAERGISGSWESGLSAVSAYLQQAGIPPTDFSLKDGSGMSKRNAVSPRALVRVLCYEFYGTNRDAYVSSLSVAGVDGTLNDRFARSDLRKRVYGKSGFVEGVSTLSGYLQAKNGQWYAFSILVNGIPRYSNTQVKLLQERIVKAIDVEVSR